jgi:hypothetical protein
MGNKKSPAPVGDELAFVIGCGAGLGGGLILGGCFAWLSGAYGNGMWMIVLMHAIFAMVLMGAWLAPTLLAEDET